MSALINAHSISEYIIHHHSMYIQRATKSGYMTDYVIGHVDPLHPVHLNFAKGTHSTCVYMKCIILWKYYTYKVYMLHRHHNIRSPKSLWILTTVFCPVQYQSPPLSKYRRTCEKGSQLVVDCCYTCRKWKPDGEGVQGSSAQSAHDDSSYQVKERVSSSLCEVLSCVAG